MLVDPVPVVSSSSPGGDRRSRSGGRGDSTGDRSRSRSSRLSPPRGRDSREGHLGARPRSRGNRALSRESCSRPTDRSWSRGRKRSRCDSSRSPSAHVRSRRSQSQSSDCYRDRQVGGFPLEEVSVSIYPMKSVATSNG